MFIKHPDGDNCNENNVIGNGAGGRVSREKKNNRGVVATPNPADDDDDVAGRRARSPLPLRGSFNASYEMGVQS